jgi:hypothetical protein
MFDVQIPSYVQSGRIARADWESVLKYMSSRARYAISSITLYELIAGIDGGDDAHFPENRDRVRVLYEPARRELLPLASDFVRRTLFRLPIRVDAFQPDKLKQLIEVILRASTKADLKGGRVRLRGQTYGSPISELTDQIRRGKKVDADRLERLRQGLLRASTQDTWSREVLYRMKVPDTPENVVKLQAAMDAAWRYELARYGLAKNQAYNFADHASDWLDSQLLYYLADPLIHFVTLDTKIKDLARGSTQLNRILDFNDLLVIAQT